VRLTGKPESEFLIWCEQLELLLKTGKPRSDQMQVLETDPLSLLSRILDKLEGDFILASTHGKLVEVLPSYDRLCKLLKLAARIGTW